MPRVMEMTSPLGDDVLLFHAMRATESLSRLSEYEIEALAVRNDLDPDAILGRTVTVRLEVADGGARWFNAHVARFGLVGAVGRHHLYRLDARPWLWLLTRAADCRIFQNRTVPEIVQEVFAKYREASFELRLVERYPRWEYCVQYRETDFNFVSRLLEQEGIHYFFEHRDGRHTLVLADAIGAHVTCPAYERIPCAPLDGARLDRECVTDWTFAAEIQPDVFVLDDFDFTRPGVDLKVERRQRRGEGHAPFEMFDYPGEYLDRGEGERYARTRLEELQCRHRACRGATNARGPGVGHRFQLTGHPREDQNGEYLLVAADYHLEYGEYEAMAGAGAGFSCTFGAMPASEPFRPARATPKPVVQGPQTAIVVGPSGDEIHTDEHGRVKVQFHWDRYGRSDENSSCWVRVSHPWAGKGWGMVAIPRIGQEVVVDFLEGDPDRPLVTGRVYNADQRPPYDLPANKTQSGIKSRSTNGGTGNEFNEIRFEDRKGAEQLYFHAERNQDNVVEHDETTDVGHDRTESVGHDESITIGASRVERVGANESVTIGGSRTHTTVLASAESVGAAKALTVGAGYAVSVGGAMNTVVGLGSFEQVGLAKQVVVGRTLRLQAGESIELVCGKSVLVLRRDGTINLNGKDIDITGDAHIQLGAERIDIN